MLDVKVLADLADQFVVNLTVPRYSRDFPRRAIDVHRMGTTLAEELATVLLKVPNEIPALHAA